MSAVRRYEVEHRTVYRYGAPMTDGYTVACLVPRPTDWQQVVESTVAVEPAPSEHDSYLDAFGNLVHQFGLHELHAALTITARSVVDVTPTDRRRRRHPWEDVVAQLDAARGDVAIERRVLPVGVDVRRPRRSRCRAAEHRRPLVHARTVDHRWRAGRCARHRRVVPVRRRVLRRVDAADAVLAARRGVCQDFAHLAVGCLRSIGLAARYVSGYIETVAAAGQARLVGADASHAWCSVWTPLAGWVDFDPTNGHLPVDRHITVAWGRDYADVTPVRGVMIGPPTTQHLDVSVDVRRV